MTEPTRTERHVEFYDWLRRAKIYQCLLLALIPAGITYAFASQTISITTAWDTFASILIAICSGRSILNVFTTGRHPVRSAVLAIATVIAYLGIWFVSPIWSGRCLVPNCSTFERTLPSDLIAAVLVGPFFETIVFQGWLQSVFNRVFNSLWISFAVTTVLFVATHGAVSPPLVVGGFLLSYIRLNTSSLLYVATAHALVNIAVALVAFRVL